MKITIQKQHLIKALTAVGRFCANKERSFSYDAVKISLIGANLCFYATDIDTEITYAVPTTLKIHRRSKAVIAVSGRTIKDILKVVANHEPVTLTIIREKKAEKGECQKPNRLHIQTREIDFQLKEKNLHIRDFDGLQPLPFNLLPNDFSFGMEAKELREILARTCYIIPDDAMRHYINGLFIHREVRGRKQFLRAVATDGHRLSVVEKPLPVGMMGLPLFKPMDSRGAPEKIRRAQRHNAKITYNILPRLAVLEIQKLIAKCDATIYANFGKDIFRFRWLDGPITIVIQSKYLNGTYPNYKCVVPKNKYEIKVDAFALAEAIDTFKQVKKERQINFFFGKKTLRIELRLSSFGDQYGQMEKEIDIKPGRGIKKLDPDPMRIGINKYYVDEHLKSCNIPVTGGHFTIGFTDKGDPVSFEKDEGYYHLVMPMRT